MSSVEHFRVRSAVGGDERTGEKADSLPACNESHRASQSEKLDVLFSLNAIDIKFYLRGLKGPLVTHAWLIRV